MPYAPVLLSILHASAALVLLGAAASRLARPASVGAARIADVAAAVLAGAVMPLTDAHGWWIDMPVRWMLPLLVLLAAALAVFGSRGTIGRPACLGMASFFMVLGLASFRNGGPLAPFLAGKSILFGFGLALLPWHGGVQLRMALLVLLLAGGAVLGLLEDIPIG